MGFKIKAADGATLEIQDREYYFNTKARCRRMMLNSLSSDARRVYACLELATMGFQQELAVVMERGEKGPVTRPLTPTDIGQQTGLLKQNVTRSLVELEDAGLAKREADDNGALRHGHIRLYSWAVPRQPKSPGSNRARLLPAWFPESWEPLKPLINRFKLSLIDDEVAARDYFEEGAAVARAYQEAEEVAARFLERVRARTPSNKEERTERTEEKETSSSDPLKLEEETTTEQAQEPQPQPLSEPEIPPKPQESQNLAVEEPETPSQEPDEVKTVERQLGIDNDAARKIVRETRWARPDATAREIVLAAIRKMNELRGGFQSGKYHNATGILVRAIPKMAASDLWLDIRKQLQQQDEISKE